MPGNSAQVTGQQSRPGRGDGLLRARSSSAHEQSSFQGHGWTPMIESRYRVPFEDAFRGVGAVAGAAPVARFALKKSHGGLTVPSAEIMQGARPAVFAADGQGMI